MLKGNKGEWSEIYAFCYLLSSGILRAADKDLNPRPDFYFPILKILRQENEQQLEYYPSETQEIRIFSGENLIMSFPRSELDDNINILLDKIPEGSRAFEIPEAEHFLDSIKITKLKAASTHKQDIDIQIHDVRTGISPVCGFSIKSYLGSNPTLINAGNGTNFIYEVEGCNDDIMQAVNDISTKTKIIDRIQYLRSSGCQLVSRGEVASQQFTENMQFVDSLMPQIVAIMLEYAYQSEDGKALNTITEQVKRVNPMGFANVNMYEYKLKKLLCACALGMTPEKLWEGAEDANGGYIVVKQDGSVLCYHIYNRTEFEQYLLDYTCFESPSTSRYGYMSVYKEDGAYKIKLNLQVRFTAPKK